jgi:hypothetical protein
LVPPDELVFFADGYLCVGRAGVGVDIFSGNVRESYATRSYATVFEEHPKNMLFWRVQNIAFRRALSTEQYKSALIVGLLYWSLNRMPSLPELCYSAKILYKNWFCLLEFDWYGSLWTLCYS